MQVILAPEYPLLRTFDHKYVSKLAEAASPPRGTFLCNRPEGHVPACQQCGSAPVEAMARDKLTQWSASSLMKFRFRIKISSGAHFEIVYRFYRGKLAVSLTHGRRSRRVTDVVQSRIVRHEVNEMNLTLVDLIRLIDWWSPAFGLRVPP